MHSILLSCGNWKINGNSKRKRKLNKHIHGRAKWPPLGRGAANGDWNSISAAIMQGLSFSLSLRVRNKWSWSRMGGTQVGVAVGEKPYHLFDGVCQPAKLHLWVVNTARCKLLQTIRFLLPKFPFAPNWNFRKIYNQSLGQQRNARKHIGKFEKILKLCCNRFPNEMVRYWRGANEKKKWGKIKTKDLISPAKRRIYMFAPLRNKFFPFSIFFPAPKRFALSISSPLWKYKIFSIFDFIFRFFFFWNAGVCRRARWCHKIKQKTE